VQPIAGHHLFIHDESQAAFLPPADIAAEAASIALTML
jgi:hypothetical protein